jgi:integrase
MPFRKANSERFFTEFTGRNQTSLPDSRPPRVLECLHPHYRNCLTILFFTGLNFGEMAALKWKNVHLDRKTAKICETLVYGEEGRTKTKKSNRDIDVLPPAIEALIDQ